MKTRPSSEFVLLGALMSGPRHGYEILQFTAKALGETWFVGTSQLYMLLKRLEGQNLLRSELQRQEPRPSKRIFTITPEGRDRFLTWLHAPCRHVRNFRTEFMAKLFFFFHLSPAGGRELIDAQIKVLESVGRKLRRSRKDESGAYDRLLFDFKIATVETRLRWLRDKAGPFMEQIYGEQHAENEKSQN